VRASDDLLDVPDLRSIEFLVKSRKELKLIMFIGTGGSLAICGVSSCMASAEGSALRAGLPMIIVLGFPRWIPLMRGRIVGRLLSIRDATFKRRFSLFEPVERLLDVFRAMKRLPRLLGFLTSRSLFIFSTAFPSFLRGISAFPFKFEGFACGFGSGALKIGATGLNVFGAGLLNLVMMSVTAFFSFWMFYATFEREQEDDS
jgi:hypothetical protein